MPINEAYRNYLRECQNGVLTEVVLSTPDPARQKALGISRVYLAGERFLTPSGADRVAAYLRIDPYYGRLLIHFLACSLSADVRSKHFDGDNFQVAAAYPIGGSVARELALAEGDYWLNTGDYPVLDDGDLLTVSVSIGRVVAMPASPPISMAA